MSKLTETIRIYREIENSYRTAAQNFNFRVADFLNEELKKRPGAAMAIKNYEGLSHFLAKVEYPGGKSIAIHSANNFCADFNLNAIYRAYEGIETNRNAEVIEVIKLITSPQGCGEQMAAGKSVRKEFFQKFSYIEQIKIEQGVAFLTMEDGGEFAFKKATAMLLSEEGRKLFEQQRPKGNYCHDNSHKGAKESGMNLVTAPCEGPWKQVAYFHSWNELEGKEKGWEELCLDWNSDIIMAKKPFYNLFRPVITPNVILPKQIKEIKKKYDGAEVCYPPLACVDNMLQTMKEKELKQKFPYVKLK